MSHAVFFPMPKIEFVVTSCKGVNRWETQTCVFTQFRCQRVNRDKPLSSNILAGMASMHENFISQQPKAHIIDKDD